MYSRMLLKHSGFQTLSQRTEKKTTWVYGSSNISFKTNGGLNERMNLMTWWWWNLLKASGQSNFFNICSLIRIFSTSNDEYKTEQKLLRLF